MDASLLPLGLNPDPYKLPSISDRSSLARIARGVQVGDPSFDELSIDVLRNLVAGLSPDVTQGSGYHADGSPQGSKLPDRELLSLPPWADLSRMRRGQQVFEDHCLYFMRAFEVALLWGCRIDRFADVLVRSGYTSSPRVAFRRFRDTARHVCTWCADKDLTSTARQEAHPAHHGCKALRSITQVRAAHSLARRRVKSAEVCSVGVPVSQYDLSFTLMAFSLIALDGVVNDFNQPLTQAEVDDYLHLWRVLGCLHGILDEFNPCNSSEDAMEILKDINELFFFAGYAFGGVGAAQKLTLTVFDGFATWGTGTGPDLLGAVFLRPLCKKPFVPLSAIDWMPVGRALAADKESSVAVRRLHIACAMNEAMLHFLSRRPSLEKGIQRTYFRLLRWGLVDGGIALNKAESFLRCLSSLHHAMVACLALVALPLETQCRRDATVAATDVSEAERREKFMVWRRSFDGFRYTGPVAAVTRLTLSMLARRVALVSASGVCAAALAWKLIRLVLALQRGKSRKMTSF
eukprot:gb/GFBE01080391.1/.p1 GENE.gb/GFBE01080391.1/~~gb/GFBE01080391.1/.p1  ORF type:complete len:519 (+),score=84.92 gb/GFBE01080391.1/:1-1557(+)